MQTTSRILVIDDNPENRTATVRALTQSGYAVAQGECGAEALAMVREQLPQLLLLDVVLPDVPGTEVVRQLRRDPCSESLSVVLLSGQHISPEQQAAGLDAGADGFIARPVSNAELLARVRLHLRQHELTAALRDSETRYRELIASQADAVLVVNHDGEVQYANLAAEVLFGRPAADLIGTAFGFPVGRGGSQELEIPRRCGAVAVAEMRVAPTRWAGADAWVATLRDISERRRIEQELRQHAALLVSAQHVAKMGSWELDLTTGRLRWSDGTCALFGLGQDSFRGTYEHFLGHVLAADRPLLHAQGERVRSGDGQVEAEYRIRRADGEVRWLYERGDVERDASGRVLRVFGMVADITARKLAEQALQQSEERFRLLSRASNDAIWDWDPVADVLWWGEGFETLFGIPREDRTLTSADWTSRIHPDDRDRVAEVMQRAIAGGHERWSNSYRFRRGDGSYADVTGRGYAIRDADGRIVRVVGGMTDVGERLQLEEQLRQSQRLESIGQLTGGIAHDFNNVLTVILGNSELLTEELAGDSLRRALAEMIVNAAQRGAELTQRLLAFARRQPLDPRAIDVGRLVAEIDGLLRRALGEQIEVELRCADGLREALVDPTQLESALLNLCINARDAMPGGGRLTIETDELWLDEDYAAQQAEVQAGRYVMLAVSDTGSGIDPANLPRVFEPFFTTKGKGKGTGLGLAMVYGFIKQSGGHVSVYSEPGQGTTLRLYLPVAEGADVRGADADPGAEVGLAGGSETILLVEDDDLVRHYAHEQLRGLGYDVAVAATGPQALDILRQRDDIHLLFTDVIMPGGMSGRELADEATRLYPQLRVLYTSGYTENAIVHHGRLDPGVRLLAKPYRRADLIRQIRLALDC